MNKAVDTRANIIDAKVIRLNNGKYIFAFNVERGKTHDTLKWRFIQNLKMVTIDEYKSKIEKYFENPEAYNLYMLNSHTLHSNKRILKYLTEDILKQQYTFDEAIKIGLCKKEYKDDGSIQYVPYTSMADYINDAETIFSHLICFK